jgi:hypothetical protein
LDEDVAGVAAVIDDVVEGLEATVREPFGRMNCQLCSWR